MKCKLYANVFYQMIRRDFTIFLRQYPSKMFDTALLLFTNLIVFAYFFPKLGMEKGYGVFIFVGAVSTFGFFEIVERVGGLIADIEGDQLILYNLTLPLPTKLIFLTFAVKWAINTFLVSIVLFFLGKLMLLDLFSLSQVSAWRFILMFFSINAFYGIFCLWMATAFKKINSLSSLWFRVINPLFMFGGYFYPWDVINQNYPFFAKVMLINPLIYVTEGMRSAVLGISGSIPFWICISMVWVFIIVCAFHGFHRMKKWLDAV